MPIEQKNLTNGALYGLCVAGYNFLSLIAERNIIIYKNEANWKDKHINIQINPLILFMYKKKNIDNKLPITA